MNAILRMINRALISGRNSTFDMNLSTESLDLSDESPYQSEIFFNQLLPYSDKINDEADTLLAIIKANFGKCVMLRDINPGCMYWSQILMKYIVLYGLRFTKDDHITFIKLSHELIIIPDLQPSLIENFGKLLLSLLKKKEALSPDDLELPWEPLYELYNTLVSRNKKLCPKYQYPISLISTLESLVDSVKIYFPPNATQRILDELRPKLCPLQVDVMCRTMRSFRVFLPVHLPEKYHSISHELWLQEIMELWEASHNDNSWENDAINLMAKLASNNIGYIDWNPYIPLMFARIIRSLDLPVRYKKMKTKSDHNLDTSAIGEWIASVLGDKFTTQTYLEKFLKTIETYFHPANRGPWSIVLEDVIIKITSYFILRLHRERHAKESWLYPIPNDRKLTDANVDAFVKSMMPIALTAIFTNPSSPAFSRILGHLSKVRPNIVIPIVLEKLYPVLGSEIESHKFVGTMTCMLSISRPLVQGSHYPIKDYAYSEGPMNVLSFLLSSLDGIDPNNPINCFATLQMIAIFTKLVPIVDCSKSNVEINEDERIIREDTSRFEDFILQFMDKIFTLINSFVLESVRLESPDNKNLKGSLEMMVVNAFQSSFKSVLLQASDSIFASALNKLRSFIMENTLDNGIAGQQIASMCRIFSEINSNLTLRTLLPHLSETILEAVEEMKDSRSGHENLDHRLLYSLLLLQQLVCTQGDALLPYMDTIIKVLDEVTALASREGNELGCHVLGHVLQSLCDVQAIRVDKNYNDRNYPYWRDWGETVDFKAVQIKWYVPGEQEMSTAQKLFTRYFLTAVGSIEDYNSGKITLTREEVQRMLRIIGVVLHGCDSVLPIWAEPALVTKPYESCVLTFKPILGNDYEMKMPDGGNVRSYLVKTMAILQDRILKNVEDDTKILNLLIQIWQLLSMNKMKSSNCSNVRRQNFQVAKKIVENKLIGNKGYLPELLLERTAIQHELRTINIINTFTETSKNIILNLFELSISQYTQIRVESQKVINAIFNDFPNAYQTIIPCIMEVLKRDTEVHHDAYKGVLYFLTKNQSDSVLTKDNWQVLSELLPALVVSKPSEKPSIIRLHEFIIAIMNKSFLTVNIKLNVPDGCISAASKLWNTGVQPVFPPPAENEVQMGVKHLQKKGDDNLKSYNDTLNKLINTLLKETLHWRHTLMAMNFIKALIHPEHLIPTPIVRYFLDALINESIDQRKLAWAVTLQILYKLKRKHRKIVIEIPNQESNVNPGPRKDNEWLQYKYDNRPTNSTQWDEPRYVHKAYLGYYMWPKKLEVYAPYCDQPTLDSNRKLNDHEKEIDLFFRNEENIAKLVKYFTLEEKKGKDRFNFNRYQLFKGLFRNHGDVYLKSFMPHLEKMVQSKEDSFQISAAEFIAGLVRGAKHWPYQMTVNLWQNLLPVITLALNNITEETTSDWAVCFSAIHKNRDPNRLHWLIEYLASEEHQTTQEVSVTECVKLIMLECAVVNQAWRMRELLNRLMPRIERRLLDNPFDIVRVRLSHMLVSIFNINFKFRSKLNSGENGYPEVDDFINKVHPRLELLLTEQDSKSAEFVSASRLLCAICHWIMLCISNSHFGVVSSFYKLYPIITQIENNEADENMSQNCSWALCVMSVTSLVPEHVPAAIQAVDKMSRSSSWSARSSAVQFLQPFLFNNMSTLLSNQQWIDTVTEIVLRTLEDERVEVREKSAQVLSGILHCTLITNEQSRLEKFKLLAKTKLRGPHAMRLRHAGVLGMCAFIQAHPYDIPKDILPIFEHLSAHLNDPAPIPDTIRKTLNDFKRTHCDGWSGLEGLTQDLTQEQFSLLQDLTLPPSHYA